MTALISKEEIKQRIFEARAQGQDLPAGYNLACLIASTALLGQRDKAGTEYMRHVNAVALHHTDSMTKMIIGTLHDVVEDTDWTLEDLREIGFSARVIAGVDGMTSRPGEPYFDFIVRGSRNPDVVDVKLHDLNHNLTQGRNNFLAGEKDLERINKYILAYNYLVAVKKAVIAPGSPFGAWMTTKAPQALQSPGLLAKYSSEAASPAPPAPPRFTP